MNRKIEYKKVVKSSSEFFKNYSVNNYSDDWKLCMSWSFGDGINKMRYLKNRMNRLKDYVLKYNDVDVFDGIYVGEYSKNYNYHLHSILYCDKNVNDVKNSIWNYCRKYGSIDLMKYKKNKGFDFYMSKYLYLSEENSFGIIGLDI